jgi:hypothetical protein
MGSKSKEKSKHSKKKKTKSKERNETKDIVEDLFSDVKENDLKTLLEKVKKEDLINILKVIEKQKCEAENIPRVIVKDDTNNCENKNSGYLENWNQFVCRTKQKSRIAALVAPALQRTRELLNEIVLKESEIKSAAENAIASRKKEFNEHQRSVQEIVENSIRNLELQKETILTQLESTESELAELIVQGLENESRYEAVQIREDLQVLNNESSRKICMIAEENLRKLNESYDSRQDLKSVDVLVQENETLKRNLTLKDDMILSFFQEKQTQELERGRLLKEIKKVQRSLQNEVKIFKCHEPPKSDWK